MTVYVLKNCDELRVSDDAVIINRLGIAVSKKFSKSSVRRNRVKRLIKEVYRLNENKIAVGYSIVFLWKNNVEYTIVNFQNVYNDFFKCMKKANLLLNDSTDK